ncbi:hypothetical protein GCM10010299_09360 [Streptomyces tanashiensis]|nr:hypothetical protein GCM10010299_09360 [Streptomyces tanashiensis]
MARKGTGIGAVAVPAAGAAALGAAVAAGATNGVTAAAARTIPTDTETRRDKPVRKALSLPNFVDMPMTTARPAERLYGREFAVGDRPRQVLEPRF